MIGSSESVARRASPATATATQKAVPSDESAAKERQHCGQRQDCCVHKKDEDGKDADENDEGDDECCNEGTDACGTETCGSGTCGTEKCAMPCMNDNTSKEELCCCCSHKKDKPAPTSRNYAKMRNRLRGLLKKKREVEEYFEYHPDSAPDRRRQESQPQVIFILKQLKYRVSHLCVL